MSRERMRVEKERIEKESELGKSASREIESREEC